jgi:hypothetical protein
MFRALKAGMALAGVLALGQYVAVYYSSVQFKEFVQRQARQAPAKKELKWALVNKAKEYSLPVTENDINITTAGSVMRVAVDYRVPLNLLVYGPELSFRAIGAGLMPRN